MSLHQSFLGSLVADALAMPAHWYYDREALRRDYGQLDCYRKPLKVHPDSILWRSHYEPVNARGDILRDQARFWGQRDIHYHQFLKAGENTINLKLAVELHRWVVARGTYEASGWAEHYVRCMLTPDWHRDTYLEEYHRGFFTRYAKRKPVTRCGIRDEHIGGLAQVPALLASLPDGHNQRTAVRAHLALTHRHSNVQRAADCFARLLTRVTSDTSLRDAISQEAGDWFSGRKAGKWVSKPDTLVVGSILSPACYIDQAFPASLYFAWKYHDDFSAGIIANAMAGGDNCHRGVVVGALLGAANGVPARWLDDLEAAADLQPQVPSTRT